MLGNYLPNDTVSHPRRAESSVQEWLHLEDEGTTTPEDTRDYSPAASHHRRTQFSNNFLTSRIATAYYGVITLML